MHSILKLTPRRLQVYDFIVKFKIDHDGVAPSVAEIGKSCGISSTAAVRYVLDHLVLLGMIECNYGAGSRMIGIVGARWIPPSEKSPVKQADCARSFSSTKA